MAWQVEHNGMAIAALARSLKNEESNEKEVGSGKVIPSPERSAMTSTQTDSNIYLLIGGVQNLGIEPQIKTNPHERYSCILSI